MANKERRVVFTLTTQVDKQYRRAYQEIGKLAEATQEKLAKSADETSTRTAQKKLKVEKESLQQAYAAGKQLADLDQKDRDAIVRARMKMIDRIARHQTDADKKAAADRLRTEKLAEAESERLAGRMANAQSRVREGFERSTEGVLKLGRGIVQLGLVGEDDLQKVVQTLLKLEGAINTTRGVIELYRGWRDMIVAVRTQLQLATAAQIALNAASSAGGSGTARGASSVAGQAAANVGGAAAAAAGGKFLSSSVGGLGVGVGGTVAALAAALASLGVAAKVTTEQVTGSANSVDSWSMKIAEFSNYLDEQRGLIDLGTERVRVAQERLTTSRVTRDAFDAASADNLAIGNAANEQRLGIGLARAELTGGGNAAQQALAASELAAAEQQLASIQLNLLATREQAEQRYATALDRVIDLQQQGLQLADQKATAEKAAAEEQLALARQQRDVAKQALEAAKSAYQSDLEQFAQLDPLEQNRLRRIKQQVDAGQTLSGDDAQFASRFNEFRDDASASLRQRAVEAGGESIFAEDRAAIRDARRQQADAQKLIVERRDEIRVVVERNEEERRKIVDEILSKLEEQDRASQRQRELETDKQSSRRVAAITNR